MNSNDPDDLEAKPSERMPRLVAEHVPFTRFAAFAPGGHARPTEA
jgi:hypothetical protein